jgi:hypothetical protein
VALRFGVLLCAVLALVGCKVEEHLEQAKGLFVQDANAIEYVRGGAFPGPNGPTYTHLILKKRSDNQVEAYLKTESCEISAMSSLYDFKQILGKVERSKIIIGEERVIDLGKRSIKISSPWVQQTYHLGLTDVSYGQPILIDGSEIELDLGAIADKLKQLHSCVSTVYTSLRFQSRSFIAATETKPKFPVIVHEVDFKLYFEGSKVRLTGHLSQFQVKSEVEASHPEVQKEVCRDNFASVALHPVFVAQANQISVQENGAICEMMEPPVTGVGISPNILLADGKKDYKPAYFSCLLPVRARGHEALFNSLNTWLRQNSKCFSGSLL